ncbi:MAG TPA: hypothetical protein VGS80_00080, partial [Ktedonobacterales bacterium]|nr:hypothetical protein [Ktedonobacterales bacterium]
MDSEVRGGLVSTGSRSRIAKRVVLAIVLAAGLVGGAALAVPALTPHHAKAASSTVVFRSIDRSAGAVFDQVSADGTVGTAVEVRVSDTAYHGTSAEQPIQYISVDMLQQNLWTGEFLTHISGVATNPDVGMGGTVRVQVDKNLRTATVTALVLGYDMVHQQEGIPIAVSLTWAADGQATNVTQEYRTQTPTYIDIEHLRGKG